MKIGFIGCGGFAQGNHIPNVAKNPNFKIRAFCDLNHDILNRLASQYAFDYITENMNEIFEDPEIEMVICSTKPDFRVPVIEKAVKNSKHLFVEKPLCYDDNDIPRIIEILSHSHIKFMIGFNRPYSPMMQDLKKLYKRLKNGNTSIIYRIVGEARLWPAHHYNAVVHDKETTIIHETTHIFDLLNWLTDSYPLSVYCAGGGNMDNIITLEYPEKVTAVIISGDNGNAGYPKERIEIDTGFNTIIGDNFTELTAYCANGDLYRTLYPYTISGKQYKSTAKEAELKTWNWRTSITEEEKKKGYYYERQVKVNKGHYEELEFFRKAIENDVSCKDNLYRAASAQIIASAAIDSWQTKKTVNPNISKKL